MTGDYMKQFDRYDCGIFSAGNNIRLQVIMLIS